MTICDRCGKDSDVTIMSYFNTDTICPACEDKEKKHPRYEEAKRIETEEVMKGNYNFEGIGKPDDL